MTNVISLTGEPIDPPAEQQSIIRVLEHALEKAKAGQLAAVSITMLASGGIPSDSISVTPENVLALSGAVALTQRRILEAVDYE